MSMAVTMGVRLMRMRNRMLMVLLVVQDDAHGGVGAQPPCASSCTTNSTINILFRILINRTPIVHRHAS